MIHTNPTGREAI